ncbi:isocitrate lyase/phosphoenolpyruvate mutase family protein [Frankia sp. B2]|jgi:2-methylisocitrate lyase-like PEP mutase family enzyme|uniref:Carboxyvinyl-carboxyphosphonate phosphorylmutase, putative n=1 Tax=Frankia casuarinae (strain DSM 45818 / CECT 9043 / HFP020203 / CcI3) TaxID=106370 RepID=Q2JAX2_FRACC|nr:MULTISPECIES: isocitrate lyase/phosphoenolpyruvate mutase family protein [Frankia]ABD11570.1 carboxyvinyl-carboxyphosphonate phosphorylmutase, putative [Frankia casuarinae]OHV52884.1 2-methylisocitrate lyase [Frankia sp. CgIS1]TFE31893.1 isocitrate lyase/phosphoenolpyruvate mutase family protein [Frankia sp. B2]
MDDNTTAQHRKAVIFRELHEQASPFVMANAWDAGTARLLTQAGFVAIGTTSAGLAFSHGVADGANLIDRTLTFANVRAIAAATPLPVSADLESCFAQTPRDVEKTVLLAAEAGAVGGSIEDATGIPQAPILALDDAVARVGHAVAAARSLPFPFVITARAENFLYGHPDLEDTIRRLQAYAAAGADVLYAPGLLGPDSIREVCKRVQGPVNVLVGPPPFPSVTELGLLGVRRISFGSLLPRIALAAVLRAAREIHEEGTFSCAAEATPYAQANQMMSSEVR